MLSVGVRTTEDERLAQDSWWRPVHTFRDVPLPVSGVISRLSEGASSWPLPEGDSNDGACLAHVVARA